MKKVTIHQAKTELSKLIKLVERGQEVLISRDSKPVARLVPLEDRPIAMKDFMGMFAGKVLMHEDFDQLPDEFMEAFSK